MFAACFGPVKEAEKEIAELMISQQEETIQLILECFHRWKTLTIYKNNLSEEESKSWNNYSEEQKRSIVKRVRKEKLKKLKAEIESEEIKKICKTPDLKGSHRKESYRKNFLKLTELLLQQIEQKSPSPPAPSKTAPQNNKQKPT